MAQNHKLNVVTLLASFFILCQSALCEEFFDVRRAQTKLYETYKEQEAKLTQRARATQKEHFRLSENMLAQARAQEPQRQRAIDEIFQRAQAARPKENGTKALSRNSRGLLGDVDLGNMSRSSFERVIKVANQMGYGVEVRGGSATIKELDTTLFYRKSKGEVFKKANMLDGEYMVGYEHNDGKNMSSAQRRVFNIFDCLKKYERSLVTSNESIRRPEVVQSMAKSTLRLYEARGAKLTPIEVIQGKIEQHLAKGYDRLPKLNKAEKLVLLKHGYSPRAVGLVKTNATASQELAALQRFQQNCVKVAKSSYNLAVKSSGKIEQEYIQKLRKARSTQDQERARKYKSKLVKHRSAYRKSHTALLKNTGLRNMAIIEGVQTKASTSFENPHDRKAMRNEIIKKSVSRQNSAANLQGKKQVRRLLAKTGQGQPATPRIRTMAAGAWSHIAIAAGSGLIGRLKRGETMNDSLAMTTAELMTSEFLFGDLLGSTVGAMVGSSIPVPAALSSMGFWGRAFKSVPAIGLAMIGGQLGHNAVKLLKSGNFTMANLLSSIDLPSLLTQTIGASLGVAASAAFIPGAVGAIVGGIVGSVLATKILNAITKNLQLASQSKETTAEKDLQAQALAHIESHGAKQKASQRDDTNGLKEQLPQLTIEVRRAYEQFMRASSKGSANAPQLFKRYKEKKEELTLARVHLKALR